MSAPNDAISAAAAGPLRRLDATGVPSLLVRLILGGVFIYMGVEKAKAPDVFLKQIHEYHMVSDEAYMLVNSMAAVLPWLEILCGVLLVAGLAVRGTALTLLAMLIVFTGAVALRAHHIYQTQAIAFCAIKFDCGCGGGEVLICRKLLENTGLMLMALYLLWSRPVKHWVALCPALLRGRRGGQVDKA